MRLIVFDVDGTLIDSRRLVVEATRRTFAGSGLKAPTRARCLSVVGLSPKEAFTALVGPGPQADELARAYRGHWYATRETPEFQDRLFDGVAEMIEALARAEVLLGIATGQSRRGVDHLLQRQGWSGHFHTIQTEETAPSKPAPDMLHQALAETGASPRETCMIGDTGFDMAMARAAGVRAVGVTWGYHSSDRLAQAGAEHLIADIPALRQFLLG